METFDTKYNNRAAYGWENRKWRETYEQAIFIIFVSNRMDIVCESLKAFNTLKSISIRIIIQKALTTGQDIFYVNEPATEFCVLSWFYRRFQRLVVSKSHCCWKFVKRGDREEKVRDEWNFQSDCYKSDCFIKLCAWSLVYFISYLFQCKSTPSRPSSFTSRRACL